MNLRPFPSDRRSRGFTFVETLVALLVLSIGLLGVAALQLSSLRTNHSASLRSQATLLAYDMVDRMRANRTAAIAGSYDLDLVDEPDEASTVLNVADLVRWKQNLASTLPAGNGSIERSVTGGVTTFTVTIQWDDSRGAAAPMQFVMETQI
jgi:type IV pilus assembly protein PilV